MAGTVLTRQGRSLQAKAQTGASIHYTKIMLGDGELTASDSLENLTALIHPVLTVGIQDVAMIGDGTSRVRALVSNQNLTKGFFVREIGIFADDPDEGEILYSIVNRGTQASFLQSKQGDEIIEQILDIITVVGNAQTVTAAINHSLILASKQDVDDHNNDPGAHPKLGGVPLGTIIAFPAAAIPPGYLTCNGAAVGRTTYPELFALLGTSYGAGNGSTTFNLPDLRGEFVRGWDNGRGVDAGRTIGSAQGDAFKSHNHQQSSATLYNLDGNNRGSGGETLSQLPIQYTQNTGGTETRPRNVAMLYCVKAFDGAVNQGLMDASKLAQDVARLDAEKATISSGVGWTKFSDGTMICYSGGASGTVLTFPLSFHAPPLVVGMHTGENTTTNIISDMSHITRDSIRFLTNYTGQATVIYTAIGRWKA